MAISPQFSGKRNRRANSSTSTLALLVRQIWWQFRRGDIDSRSGSNGKVTFVLPLGNQKITIAHRRQAGKQYFKFTELKSSVDLQSSDQSNEGLFVKTQGLGCGHTIAASLGQSL